MMTQWLFTPLAAINLAAFFLCGIDKLRAKRGTRRIREKTLLGWSFCFGSAGMFAGMLLFHHKTRDKAFVPWVPLMLIIQIALVTAGWHALYGTLF